MERWHFSGSNPITSYVLGLELRQPLSQESIRGVANQHAAFIHDLPRKLEQQSVTFQVGAGSASSVVSAIGGVVFDAISRDGAIATSLNVTPTTLTYMASQYRRWKEYWPFAERQIDTLLGFLPADTVVSAFVLQSVNKFHTDDASQTVDVSDLIASETSLVPRNLTECRNFAHSFHGFQVDQAKPPGARFDNVNVILSRNAKAAIEVDVTFNFRFLPTAPASTDNLRSGASVRWEPGCEAVYKALHERNNDLFKEVISEPIWKLIPGLGVL